MNAPESTAGSAHTPGSRRERLHSLVLLLVLLTGVFWWHILSSGERMRQEAFRLTELRAQQVNIALSEATSALFFNVDAALQSLVEFYTSGKHNDFDQKTQVLLKRFPANSVIQASVIGIDGYALYSNLGLKDRIYLGDREHFRVHLQAASSRLFISKPVMGRISKQWSIQFTRPILRNGQLLGVMVLSMSPDYLQYALAQLTQKSADIIAILSDSGLVIARNRDAERAIGLLADQPSALAGLNAGSSGSYTAISNIDAVQRLYYWYRLRDYPVTVLFGVSMQSALQSVDRVIAEDRFKSIVATLLLWVLSFLAFFMTQRMQSQSRKRQEFEYAASHDLLTGLGNRQALMAHMEGLVHAPAAETLRFAMLFIDLDGFKCINDTHGHAAGDALLKVVASRIKACLKSDDIVTRIGGDEFVVITHDLGNHDVGPALAARILAALRQPIIIGQQVVSIDASIGMACYPADGRSTDELLLASDRAMYTVKNKRRSGEPAASGL